MAVVALVSDCDIAKAINDAAWVIAICILIHGCFT